MADSSRRFRRPARLDPQAADQLPGGLDPAVRTEIAHATACALVFRGRLSEPDVVDRMMRLVEAEGLELLAAMWSHSPANTLPGALWRLYLLREWVRLDPDTVACRYQLGLHRAEVEDVIAGVARPPGPQEVRRLADDVLSGVFTGELDVALERAGAFCRVLATGSALDADWVELADAQGAQRLTTMADSLLSTAVDLEQAAKQWRAGCLE